MSIVFCFFFLVHGGGLATHLTAAGLNKLKNRSRSLQLYCWDGQSLLAWAELLEKGSEKAAWSRSRTTLRGSPAWSTGARLFISVSEAGASVFRFFLLSFTFKTVPFSPDSPHSLVINHTMGTFTETKAGHSSSSEALAACWMFDWTWAWWWHSRSKKFIWLPLSFQRNHTLLSN